MTCIGRVAVVTPALSSFGFESSLISSFDDASLEGDEIATAGSTKDKNT